MKPSVLAALFAAYAACTLQAKAAVQSGIPAGHAIHMTRLASADLIVSCAPSAAGDCHYLILVPLCQESLLPDGAKLRSCEYRRPVPPFQLKPNATKIVRNLPSDFIYTMKNGSAPTEDECVAAPLPH